EALKGQEEIGRLRELAAKVGELEEKLGRLEVKELREELAAIRGLKEEIEKINEPGELKALEAKKLEEVEAARKGVVEKIEKVKEKVGDTGLGKKVEELGEKFKRLTEQDSAELEKFWAKKLLGEQERKNLKKKLEELAAIRELKELGLEEQLRILAEIKEVKRLAERQKAGEFGIQEGLQLTEKITALSVGIVGGKGRLEAKKLGEADGRLVEKLERLGRLDELVPGKRAQALEEMKATLKQLKEIKLREVKAEIEAQKSAKFKEKNLVAQSVGIFGTIFGLVERTVTGRETLGNVLKIQDVAKLENLQAKLKEATEKKGGLNALEELEKIKGLKVEKLAEGLKALAKIKALEELTEIAEKRGVATTLKAALTSAMEMAKNRGWTDYLNSLDVSERANAARELIAAEKIRKWARDINNLDADERAMVAGA
ncbi:P44/Msp2 family outer membrane protein, partial [Anaplasma marginale]